MSEIIEQALATVETPEAPEAVEQSEAPEINEGEAKAEAPKVDDPWPKTAKNAITKRDRQIGKLRAEIEQLRAQVTQKPEQKTDLAGEAPDESRFDNYGDYLKAVAKHEAREELKTAQQQEKQSTLQAKEAEYYAEREATMMEKNSEMAKVLPDYQQMILEHGDTLDSFNVETLKILLEADNAPLGLYTLAKEGKLEQFASLPPHRAAMELAKAEYRGEQFTKKPVTKAPAPMSGVKGSGAGSKSLDSMSYEELKTFLNS